MSPPVRILADTSHHAISFHTQFPGPGRYRLFLDFRHGGSVHTPAFTVTVAGSHDH